MRVIQVSSRKFRLTSLLFWLVIILLINLVGYMFNNKYISIFAAIAETNKSEVRCKLLMEAMNSVGVCEPSETALVWASGLKNRSAAIQYAVMTESLRKEYAKQLESTFPNWVTGLSSPWVEDYEIINIEAPNPNQRIITLKISTMTSTGPAGEYNAYLTMGLEGSFWRISEITMDKELYPYTGFKEK